LGAFGNAVLFPTGEVVETLHFKQRMAQRRFGSLDLVNLAYEGRILASPQWDAQHREWKWRVEGPAVDGRPIAVAFTVLGERRVKAVTIMRRRGR
jgi:hypothetical protein